MARIDSLSVAELERILESRRTELSQLTSRREKLVADLAKCDSRISELSGRRSTGRQPKVARRKKPGGGRKQNPHSLAAIIRDTLENAKKPLSLDEIVDKAKSSGYKTKSANFKNVVYQNLFHMRNKGDIGYDADRKLYQSASA